MEHFGIVKSFDAANGAGLISAENGEKLDLKRNSFPGSATSLPQLGSAFGYCRHSQRLNKSDQSADRLAPALID